MPNSCEKQRLQDLVAEDQHDVEAIEIHIVQQDEASITSEQMSCLRGLQDMYRKRIIGLEVAISRLPVEAALPISRSGNYPPL